METRCFSLKEIQERDEGLFIVLILGEIVVVIILVLDVSQFM